MLLRTLSFISTFNASSDSALCLSFLDNSFILIGFVTIIDVSSAIQSTWNSAQTQIKNVVNNVVFPVIDMILAVLFFVKLATAYIDYRKHGQFEFAAPAILFGCLVFALTAPMYIWTVLG